MRRPKNVSGNVLTTLHDAEVAAREDSGDHNLVELHVGFVPQTANRLRINYVPFTGGGDEIRPDADRPADVGRDVSLR